FSVLFYSSTLAPDFHTFPTRRSSDLGQRQSDNKDDRHRQDHLDKAGQRELDGGHVGHRPRGNGGGTKMAEIIDREFEGVSVQLKDRKSTRLNSSHVSISYAVFCLKKK